MNKGALLILLTVFLVACGGDKNELEQSPPENLVEDEIIDHETINDTHEEPGVKSPATGLSLLEPEPNAFSVMIENSQAARPQSGLSSADIVYEMKVEGNITRYLALFHDETPATVGPIRSSRHYFIPMAESYKIPYLHYGGSPQAYKELKTTSIPHIDGLKDGKYFYRDQERYAPHNAYLKTSTLPRFDYDFSNLGFDFEDMNYDQKPKASSLEIEYNAFTTVRYDYNSEINGYERSLEGKKQIDKENDRAITTSNVIVMSAEHNSLNDDKGRINIELEGKGLAVYFTEGTMIEGYWKKEKDSSIEFYTANGYTVNLSSGKTWVQVIDDNVSFDTYN